jgi:DNA gyrase subunit B
VLKLASARGAQRPRPASRRRGSARHSRHPEWPAFSRYNRSVVEQAAIAGVLNPHSRQSADGECRRDYIAKRLDALAEEVERGWSGTLRRR